MSRLFMKKSIKKAPVKSGAYNFFENN